MDRWMDRRTNMQCDLSHLALSLSIPLLVSTDLSVCRYVSVFQCLVCLLKCLSACQNVCLPVKCLSVCLSIYLLAFLSCSVLTRLHPELLRSEIIRRSLLRLPLVFGTSTIQIYVQERSWNVPALCWLLRRTSYLK